LRQSPLVTDIYAAPGNAGTALTAHNVNIKATDSQALCRFAQEHGVGLVVIGPEGPLAQGIVDCFETIGIPVFGPRQAAAQIEASKVFAKELLQKYRIPCALSASFSSYNEAEAHLNAHGAPVVIKADGLAAGKGVTVAMTTAEAHAALRAIMTEKQFGEAGCRVVIEEYLTGKEVSVFVFSDGTSMVPLVSACDYKAVYDDNRGPNTGGMGAYSPPPFYMPALDRQIMEIIMRPVVQALAQEGRPYRGLLYGGIIVTSEGPKALEFNARFGDPETQVVLPLLKSDLVEIMLAVARGNLGHLKIEWRTDACVCVVLASEGYPGEYKTGVPISGLDQVDPDIMVFHAGTRPGPNPGQILTSGGRVLSVVARGATVKEARDRVYANVSRIHFPGCHYRKDIAQI
jgi:phosphoribosylamine--glycine ligase